MKKLLSIFSVILAICMFFSACGTDNGSSAGNLSNNSRSVSESTTQPKPLHQEEVPEGYIGIYTVEDLINSGANTGGYYILMNDLDLSSVEDWESIKNTATFDGNNYTISNLCSTHGGLFSEAESVKNLHIKDCSIDVSWHYDEKVKYVGTIADSCGFALNCSASGKVKFTLSDGDVKEYAVGGLFGYQKPGEASISFCTNNVDVLGSTTQDCSDYLSLFVGGIVGLGRAVEYCENAASIELKRGEEDKVAFNESAAGGIIGGVYLQTGNISYSSNSGEVRTDYNGGGILGFGYEESSSAALTIDSCYNTGNITGSNTRYGVETSVGGICGYIEHYKPIRESTKSKIINCYNIGICLSDDYCGAILGYKIEEDTTQIQYCAYNNSTGLNITGTNAMYADNKAMTLEEMKELNNYPFNNKDAWKNGIGDYPYPIFQ